MLLDYFILAVVITGIVVSLLYSLITGISPVSSTFKSRRKIIQTVETDQEGFTYELGAGAGGQWHFLLPGAVLK